MTFWALPFVQEIGKGLISALATAVLVTIGGGLVPRGLADGGRQNASGTRSRLIFWIGQHVRPRGCGSPVSMLGAYCGMAIARAPLMTPRAPPSPCLTRPI